MWLSRAWDRDHSLRNYPRQSDLCQSAALALGQCLDLLDNLLVFVEVLALEFGDCGICQIDFHHITIELRLTCAAEVIGCEVIGGLVVEVVHEPTVTKRAVCYVGDVKLASGRNESVGLVYSLKGRVFSLNGVNLGDCECVSDGR